MFVDLKNALIIVEGRNDKLQLLKFLPNSTVIFCTNGTMDEEDLLDLLEPYEDYMFVTLFDADKNGDKLRKVMNRIYPEAIQLEIPKQFKQVEETPVTILQQLIKTITK